MEFGPKEKKVHGSPLYPFEIYHNRKEGEIFFVPCHWHEETEILYLISGQLHLTVNGTDYSGGPGDIFMIGPGELHSMQSSDDDMLYYACVFQLPFLSFERFDQGQSQWLNPILSHRLLFPAKISKETPGAEPIAAELTELIDNNLKQKPAYQLLTKAGLLKIIGLMAQNDMLLSVEQKTTPYSTEKMRLMKDIVSYLQSHYDSKITLESISQEFNLSPKYFCRFFKKNFGRTMVEYLNYFRLERAAELLLETNHKILNIALSVGFDNFSYFIKKFKELFGCTPSVYRRQGEAK